MSSQRSSISKDLEIIDNVVNHSSGRTSINGPDSFRSNIERIIPGDILLTTIPLRLSKTDFITSSSRQSNSIAIPIPDFFKVTFSTRKFRSVFFSVSDYLESH